MVIIIVLLSFFLFLFHLYLLCKDDVLLLRKNVSLDLLFNIAFLSLLTGLLFARIIFVVFHFNLGYLNPFVFFAVPYFPGMSLAGGILGVLGYILLYTRSKKMPMGKVIDFFALSFLFSMIVGFLGYIAGRGFIFPWDIVFGILFIVLYFVGIKIFLPLSLRGNLKDGSVGTLMISFISLVLIVVSSFTKDILFPFIGKEAFLFTVITIAFFAQFIRAEKFVQFRRKK